MNADHKSEVARLEADWIDAQRERRRRKREIEQANRLLTRAEYNTEKAWQRLQAAREACE